MNCYINKAHNVQSRWYCWRHERKWMPTILYFKVHELISVCLYLYSAFGTPFHEYVVHARQILFKVIPGRGFGSHLTFITSQISYDNACSNVRLWRGWAHGSGSCWPCGVSALCIISLALSTVYLFLFFSQSERVLLLWFTSLETTFIYTANYSHFLFFRTVVP